MTNNYAFQRMLSTFDLNRNYELTIKVFELGGYKARIPKSLVKSWRTHNKESRHHRPMPDDAIKAFFDGIQQASIEGLIIIYLNV